jgi:hypothetical protein
MSLMTESELRLELPTTARLPLLSTPVNAPEPAASLPPTDASPLVVNVWLERPCAIVAESLISVPEDKLPVLMAPETVAEAALKLLVTETELNVLWPVLVIVALDTDAAVSVVLIAALFRVASPVVVSVEMEAVPAVRPPETEAVVVDRAEMVAEFAVRPPEMVDEANEARPLLIVPEETRPVMLADAAVMPLVTIALLLVRVPAIEPEAADRAPVMEALLRVAAPNVVSVPVLVSPVIAAEAAVKAPVTEALFRVAAPDVMSVPVLVSPIMIAEAAVKAPVTEALLRVAAPDVAIVPVLVSPVIAAEAAVKAPVTEALFRVAVPDVVSVPVLVSPVMVAEAAAHAPVTEALLACRVPVFVWPDTVAETADKVDNVETPRTLSELLVSKPLTNAAPAFNVVVMFAEAAFRPFLMYAASLLVIDPAVNKLPPVIRPDTSAVVEDRSIAVT